MNQPETRRPDAADAAETERGEHPTETKERIQRDEPRDDRVRERGANTGGGQLRPDER